MKVDDDTSFLVVDADVDVFDVVVVMMIDDQVFLC